MIETIESLIDSQEHIISKMHDEDRDLDHARGVLDGLVIALEIIEKELR